MSLSLSLPAVAVGKPVIAKIADVASRAYAYLGVCAFVSYLSFTRFLPLILVLFYIIGYVVIASAQSINAVAAGIVIYSMFVRLAVTMLHTYLPSNCCV